MFGKKKDNSLAGKITAVILLALAVAIVVQNLDNEQVNLLFFQTTMPTGVLILLSMFLGAVLLRLFQKR